MGAIRELLIGRTVTKVGDVNLELDDGTQLIIGGNEGCGGCERGWYEITELNDCPVNAIMAVELVSDEYAVGGDEFIRLFVLAEDQRIKLLEAKGEDNGYYGTGFWIEVRAPHEAQ
jgi:hypothetical protein